MALSLLIFTLALLNEGYAATEVTLKKANILYYAPGSIDKDGALFIDYQKYEFLEKIPFIAQKQYKISKGKPYRDGTKITDASFYMVPKEGFEQRQTSLALNDTEKLCDAVKAYHQSGIYAQLGYSVLAIEKDDIAPSFTYLLANFPKKFTIKYADLDDIVTSVPAQTCDSYDPADIYFEFVLHKSGFVAAECIPNTAVPTDASKCQQTIASDKKHFEKYKQAVFKGGPDTIKEVLIKYGAVRIYDGTVIVGWEGTDWVTVEESPAPEPAPTRNDGEATVDLLPYSYKLGIKPISTWGEVQGFVFNNGFTALRAGLGLFAAVLVLPALLL